jgi:hypothetical protein
MWALLQVVVTAQVSNCERMAVLLQVILKHCCRIESGSASVAAADHQDTSCCCCIAMDTS